LHALQNVILTHVPATAKPKVPKLPKFFHDLVELHAAKGRLLAGQDSPLCLKCRLHDCGAREPYIRFRGAEHPLLTVVFDSISRREDEVDELGADGSPNSLLIKALEQEARDLKFDPAQVRYVATTRCANRQSKGKVNYKTHGNWCRYFAVQDLRAHPPKVVMTVGTVATGLLSHKGNVYDWAGKVLNWRGWPDDWITDSRFTPVHPIFGAPPREQDRLPLVPVQAPRLVYMTQNPQELARWRRHIRRGLELALHGTPSPSYERPWFNLVEDPASVITALQAIPRGISNTYDTETTGLLPFAAGAKIVFMMFRYALPDGQPRAVAFPWDYPESPLFPYIAQLTPYVLDVLYNTRLNGHNLPFDILFSFATLEGADLNRLTAAMDCDTRHLIYTYRQSKESLGLERVAYDWCQEMAGYEELFELLKQSLPALLDPGAGQGGHYAKCPRELWPTHLVPYVFGDVEVAAITKERVWEKLQAAKSYQIPICDPKHLGRFRDYGPLHRTHVYRRIMLPSQRVLTRVMGRGMFVNLEELTHQEDLFPKLIFKGRTDLRTIDERIIRWCDQQEATVPDWKLDLEDREQLKTILFEILGLPVKRLTTSGIRIHGEDLSKVNNETRFEYAAIDKFTLNGLVAEFPRLEPLLKYRKLYKQYTTYVRSMRNIFTQGIDKKLREKEAYLMPDGCVHPSFNQCGTRGGRLSSSNPNAQQLPKDSIVKRIYVSRFGERGCIYQADLSQIELRLIAAACGDPLMVKTYREGTDIHSLTMSRIYRLPYEQCVKEYVVQLQKEGRDDEAKKMDIKRRVAKCVDPDTLVEINDQVTRIGALHPGREPDTFYDLTQPAVFTRAPQGKV
jgi:hypothetical protein